MKKFLIQTINGMVVHEFAFHLIQAIHYANWFYREEVYGYECMESTDDAVEQDKKNMIPIGSLEFVSSFTKAVHGIEQIKPLNIPESLRSPIFTKRNVYEAKKDAISFDGKTPLFVKSATQYKTFTEIVSSSEYVPDDTYLVSEVIDIESEWRTFVHQGELVGIHNYSGDFTQFPDVQKIKDMIQAYQAAPSAYTLDVGVTSEGEVVVIEVHPFVSCGLYGFQDYKRLPLMFIEGYRSFIS